MKTTGYPYLFVIILLSVSCENFDLFSDPEQNNDPADPGAFSLVINDSLIYDGSAIDFYDMSSHLIYLKEGYSFVCNRSGSFSIYTGDEEIYTGILFPPYSCMIPIGPVIYCPPYLYNDYIIPIGFSNYFDSLGNPLPDPRDHPQIIEALKENDQYRAGLSCEITEIEKSNPNKIDLTLKLTNREEGDIYYLDPRKMGTELFHYFTNGLYLTNSEGVMYTPQLSVSEPEPWDAWEPAWLSPLSGGASQILVLSYSYIEVIGNGEYAVDFIFPGLGYQVSRDDLQQYDRLWLGKLLVSDTLYLETP
jgi:hypothetical protein